GTITLQVPDGTELGAVHVFNAVGSLVHADQLTAAQTTLDLHHLPNGTYVVEVIGRSTRHTQRLVKVN
nr:T9SS type A sorting domain-containing protein [Flavobacteriales bacterium]